MDPLMKWSQPCSQPSERHTVESTVVNYMRLSQPSSFAILKFRNRELAIWWGTLCYDSACLQMTRRLYVSTAFATYDLGCPKQASCICYLSWVDAKRASCNPFLLELMGSWSNLGPHLCIPVIQFVVKQSKDHNLDQNNFVVKLLVTRRLEVIPDVKVQLINLCIRSDRLH